ncbi:MAG: hypothetical protein J7M30_14780, partial [Deltaproteobacteria bacterium]|nr:hypothetical protein [Deltaproteobacteria bacterium]
RKDRSLNTVSDFGYDKYPKKGAYCACVKVIDVFGCDTSITVEVNKTFNSRTERRRHYGTDRDLRKGRKGSQGTGDRGAP